MPELASLPETPIQRISFPRIEQLGNTLYVKRDDLLPFSLGGNKVRIAHEFIRDMGDRGCDALIMYGDLQSNLCRVLASLCHMLAIPCLMVATDHDEELREKTARASFNELLVRRLGVDIIRCEKTNVATGVDEAMARLESAGRRPYYVYGNRYGTGNEGVAARAYRRAYDEICRQEQALGLHFDLIVTPYGTGCTQGGLICGSLEHNDHRKILGISISSRPPERAHAVLNTTVRDWYAKEGMACPHDIESHINLETRYTCGGYGISNDRVNALVEYMLAENSLPTDPTYTGKALLGLGDYVADHEVRDATVLFLHTGGLPLFFDYLSQQGA